MLARMSVGRDEDNNINRKAPTECSGKRAGNGVLAKKEADSNRQIERRVKGGQIGDRGRVEARFERPDKQAGGKQSS